jgi:hypothetical protein
MGINEQAKVENSWKILEILNFKTEKGLRYSWNYIDECSLVLFEAYAGDNLSKHDYCRMIERHRLIQNYSTGMEKAKLSMMLSNFHQNGAIKFMKESCIDALKVIEKNKDRLQALRDRAVILTDDQILKDWKDDEKRDMELTLEESQTKFIFESIIPNIFM